MAHANLDSCRRIAAAGHALEYQWIERMPARCWCSCTRAWARSGSGAIFRQKVARATGCRALVYDRYGYGNSDVLREARVGVEFMHDGALNELPELLENLNIENPILVGHSDGASIALIHAGTYPVRGVAVMAPHVFVEDIWRGKHREASTPRSKQAACRQRLGKYHRDARKTFHLWADAWLDPAFRKWNIEEYLPRIKCPVLAIQGEDDEYGTMAQLDAIARAGGRALRTAEAAGLRPFAAQGSAGEGFEFRCRLHQENSLEQTA